MNRLVLDASVAAKWYLPDETEPFATQAIALFYSYAHGTIEILVPDLFFAEMGQIFWKAERSGRCLPTLGEASIAALIASPLLTFGSAGLIQAALIIARRHRRTVYDSLYIALAVQESATMITADEKLANAVAAYLPVRWLGAM